MEKVTKKKDKAPFLCEIEGCSHPHIPFQRYCNDHLIRSILIRSIIRQKEFLKDEKEEE